MASTLLLVILVQLVTLSMCITNGAIKDKEEVLDTESDLSTQETGWIFQEKARELENLKNKLLSPFSSFKSPYKSYGGGYPYYSPSVNFQPSYSFGVSYPTYSSGSNSFKKYPVNYINSWYNKGSNLQNKFNYAPDCWYQTPSKPISTYFPAKPTYSYGTPLNSYYNKPNYYYGSPAFGFSAKASLNAETGGHAQFQPGPFPSKPFLSKSSLASSFKPDQTWSHILPSSQLYSGASFSLSSNPSISLYSSSSPSTPYPPTSISTLPDGQLPYSPNPLSKPTGSSQAYPGSWSPAYAYYSSSPVSVHSAYSSTPTPPSWSALSPTIPSSVQPQNPSTPSPPWSSIGESVPSVPGGQQFLVLPASPQPETGNQEVNGPQEVVITPPSQENLAGTKSYQLDQPLPIDPGSTYAVSYYPNVFYISNGQFIDKSPSTQTISGESVNQSAQPPSDSPADVPPESSTATPEDNSSPSSRAHPINSEGSVLPVLTNVYSSNTIDQTRIPVLPQPYVPPYGYVYSYSPQVPASGYSVPYSLGVQGSFRLGGSSNVIPIKTGFSIPQGFSYRGYNQGYPTTGQVASLVKKNC